MKHYNRAIMIAITEFYEDEEMVSKILSELYNDTQDDDLKHDIVNWFNATDRC